MALALGLLAVPVPSLGQQPAKDYRIGVLWVTTLGYETDAHQCPITGDPRWQAFVAGLREYGYIPGQNLRLECRWAEGQQERAQALAAELVSLQPDLLVTMSGVNIRAAKQATRTLPIVMSNVTDPVRMGVIASLAHPGGNITGLTDTPGTLEGKRLQLLMEVLPQVSHVAALGGTGRDIARQPQEAAAQALHLALQRYEVRSSEEFAGAFAAMTKAHMEALLVPPDPLMFSHARRIAELALQHRLPGAYPHREFAEAGGLVSYDMDRVATLRRLGFYVDRILHAAKPADLPVEQPTKYDLLINLKTAKALGLTIPQSLLNRADEVIR